MIHQLLLIINQLLTTINHSEAREQMRSQQTFVQETMHVGDAATAAWGTDGCNTGGIQSELNTGELLVEWLSLAL